MLDQLLCLQRATGAYATDWSPSALQGLDWSALCAASAVTPREQERLRQQKPATFSTLLNLLNAGHNTYCGEDGVRDAETEQFPTLAKSELFQKYPVYTREDFFDHLCTAGYERSRAFEISEFIRRGYASDSREKHQEQLKEYALPADLEALAKRCAYLFPRAHITAYLLQYLRMAKYMKLDRQTYCRVVFGPATRA